MHRADRVASPREPTTDLEEARAVDGGADLGAGRLDLANTDFDTGKPSARGEYELADETYAELLHRLADRKFAGLPDALRRNITAFYAGPPNRTASKKEQKRLERIRRELAALAATKDTKETKDTKARKTEPGI